MKTKEEAIKDLLSVLPHFRLAIEEARSLVNPEGMVGIAIGCFNPDRSGEITARFEGVEFFDDLAIALDAGPPTEDEMLDAKAVRMIDQMRRNGGHSA